MKLPFVSVILAVTTWYLASMAEITRAAWSRYPKWLDDWLSCPACSGAWWCGLWALLLAACWPEDGWDWFGLGLPWSAALSVLWGCFWVPLGAYLLDFALRKRGQD